MALKSGKYAVKDIKLLQTDTTLRGKCRAVSNELADDNQHSVYDPPPPMISFDKAFSATLGFRPIKCLLSICLLRLFVLITT